MSLRLVAAVALTLLALQPGSAPAASIEGGPAGGTDIAVAACMQPALGASWLIQARPDGIGGYAVWLVDDDRRVWLCNADASGAVYANVPMAGDLLGVDISGLGAAYVPALAEAPAAGGGEPLPRPNPMRLAEAACRVMAVESADAALAAIAEDGLGAYLAWFQEEDGALWLCDASADGAVFAYEPVENRPLATAGV